MDIHRHLKPAIITGALALFAGNAWAGPDAGDKTFTLSGTGTSDTNFDTNLFGASGELGWFLSDSLEAGVRQSVNVAALDDADDAWSGGTRAFADYHFGSSNFRPFVGANLGGAYGEGVAETFAAGPEVGMKYYVKDKTFIELAMEYQFLFKDADDVDDNFDDGAFQYTLGVGFNF